MTSPLTAAMPVDDLAAEYVLGTLSAARRREVEERLANDAALQAAVRTWHERLLPLTALAEPVEPSAAVWQRIEASLSPAAARPPARPTVRAGWWQNLQLWRGLAFSGFAAAALLAAVLVQRVQQEPASPRYLVVLVSPQGQAPGWVVQAAVQGGGVGRQLTLVPMGPQGSAPVPSDKALQFWTKADGWNAPVSLGLVQPGQRINVPLDQLPPLQPNQLFELTLEPATGSPTGRPTGPIQFIGRAVQL